MGEAALPVKRRRKILNWLRIRLSNPLIVKELRGRMRGARAFVVLSIYLLLLSCFTSIIYYAFSASSSGPGGATAMADAGKVIFYSVIVIEIFMVSFVTPGFTSGAISGEKERKTFEVLRTTLLPAHKVVSGKFSSALTYMVLLILAAVPLESLAFVLGGVVVAELVLALVILCVAAFFFASVGLFFSSVMRSTLAATILTYVVALLTTIGLPVLILILASTTGAIFYGTAPGSVPPWVWEAVLIYAVILLAGLSPVSAAVGTELLLTDQDALFYYWQDVGYAYGYSMAPSGPTRSVPVPSPWIIYVLVYLVLSVVLLLLTGLWVQRQARK
jgi:ABC-type transport system involved in multi-copper enzyme maturation permease subunit